MDYLLASEGRGVASFRNVLGTAREAVLSDRSLLNDVAEAAFSMREFYSFEILLESIHGVAIRLVLGRDEEPRTPSAVLCSLDPTNALTFRFSGDLNDHPHANILLKNWVQSLPLLVYFAHTNHVETGRAWLSIGDIGILPGLAFCDYRDGYYLIPDPVFMQTAGYADAKRTFSTQPVAWDNRTPIAFWRGQTTGWANAKGDPVRSWEELPRVRLCRIARSEAAGGLVDAGLTGLAQIVNDSEREAIRREGLLDEHVPWREFQKYRYQIDIDGNSNSWPGLFIKLCSGCPVLKIKSSRGFRQWYYDRLNPWQHFVPVEADMSDLLDKVSWLKQHDDFAREIGRRAKQLVLSMTEDAEILSTAPTIKKAFRHELDAPSCANSGFVQSTICRSGLPILAAQRTENEAPSRGFPMIRTDFGTLGDETVELETFRARVSHLTANAQPVKLYLGPGYTPKIGFINIDKFKLDPAREFFMEHPDDYIVFPFAERPWPIPDNSVDYIYHEDMFEHIPQKNQLLLLAETLRVLKPGAIHRINTPCLVQAMRTNSDFSRGFAGVYVSEWDRWGHVALVSRASLEEMALLVGYRYVYFTAKGKGMSPFATPELAPAWRPRPNHRECLRGSPEVKGILRRRTVDVALAAARVRRDPEKGTALRGDNQDEYRIASFIDVPG